VRIKNFERWHFVCANGAILIGLVSVAFEINQVTIAAELEWLVASKIDGSI